MKIAIHAADLDHQRIDGTRVYILNILKNFGIFNQQFEFYIYHKSDFNSQLTPPTFKNYFIKKIPFPKFWTQTRFACQLFRDKPDVLWIPMHNLPRLRRKNLKTVVTIHDLAFKIFPEYFPKRELANLNNLTDYAVKNADSLIAISQTTKNDILKFYPTVRAEKIKVIRHGFDQKLFQSEISQSLSEEILASYKLKAKNYLLYVGAIQPRKNLITLVKAFEELKKSRPEMKLVIAGEPAWNFEETFERIKESLFKDDIIITGKVPFNQLPTFYRRASLFVFPTLYEGFGIPVLEAFASGIPVVCAGNSSLLEVAGQAALYFDAENVEQLAESIEKVLSDEALAEKMIQAGRLQAQKFSWEKCAKETLEFIGS
jgi:glycosyltransferase involved in cell wall biosynthesis